MTVLCHHEIFFETIGSKSIREAPMSLIRDDIDACVFDAYDTLFDFAVAAARHKDLLAKR